MLFQDFDPCYTKQASNFMEISFQVRYDSFTNKTDQDFNFLVCVALNQAACTSSNKILNVLYFDSFKQPGDKSYIYCPT